MYISGIKTTLVLKVAIVLDYFGWFYFVTAFIVKDAITEKPKNKDSPAFVGIGFSGLIYLSVFWLHVESYPLGG